jgi:hypothetical protein
MHTETSDITLLQGLFEQGDHIDFLLNLWPDLRNSSADATRAPEADFFSFVNNSFYFAVIHHKKRYDRHSKGAQSNGELPTQQRCDRR